MKKTRISFTIICLTLALSTVFNLSGCAAKIRAYDLTNDVKAEYVSEKSVEEEFVDSQARLSVELFKASAAESKNKNVLISPLSVQLALAMTANGADGKTRDEMEALLGGGLTVEELNEYLYSYANALPSGEKYKLSIANSIWFRDDESRLTVEKDFLQTVVNYYKAQIYKAPFDRQTLKDINNWVDRQTDGMIDKILDEIKEDTVMYIINALVFDAEWEEPYYKSDVYKSVFTSITGEKRDVKMMRSSVSQYLDDGSATGFIKNYKDGKYSFAALLPNEGTDIYEYIDGLSGEGLLKTLKGVENRAVKTVTPKFSYEYELIMNGVLSELGMPTAFSGSEADFSKTAKSSAGNIYIGEVLHKTFISVDERGTKAGAVTKVELRDKSAPAEAMRTVVLDRPFVYMILDNSTNLPIFIGVAADIQK